MVNIRKIAILGTGGNCVDILDTILDMNVANGQTRYQCIGFLDDDEARWGQEIHGVKVLGPLRAARDLLDVWFVNGIGSPFTFSRKPAIIARAGVADERFATLVHPTASVSRLSQLGHGTVVFQNVTITSNVRIGNHVIILPNSVVSHDDTIGDHTCIAGGVCISGSVHVGRACYLGTNCSIIGNITIGENCLIGMGSVVLADVPANTVVVGNPAKPLRRAA